MNLTTVLMKALGLPLAKFLLKKYLSDPVEGVAGGLLDLAQKRITDYADQREAQRQFERLGERIVLRLVSLFETETRNAPVSVPAVAAELAQTLESYISAEFFLVRDLNPAKLTVAFRTARPLPDGHFSAAEVALYDRALGEAVRYLVEVASHLSKFEEAYAAVSLQRLSRISDDLDKVLDTIQRMEFAVARLAVRPDDDERYGSARYETDYRQAVMRNLDYLELFGADISSESRRHALSVAYISLNLKTASGDADTAESLPVQAVLDSLRPGAGRLLIRGEAGSGKSTLSRWIAIEAAFAGPDIRSTANLRRSPDTTPKVPVRQRRNRHSTTNATVADADWRSAQSAPAWRRRIPFLLRLRDCKDGYLPGPDTFPGHVANEIGNPPADWVTSTLRNGNALVLLDGIDEVPNVHREQLHRAISNFVNAYPTNYFIASTRPTAVEEGWLAAAGFREATIDPMSELDRTLFIDKWHDAVARELVRLGRPDPTLPQIASALVEQLPEQPSVARLAANPLLCAMICALHRERSQKLPENQAELCEAICQMLLHRRERESGLAMDAFSEAYRALTYPEKRAIVQDIAHYMVRNGESTIGRERARGNVQDSLRQFPDRRDIDSNELLKVLIERSGVLRETRPGELDFIHNTLKEYLAAERFADAGDAGQLADRFADAGWQPVILFSVATNRRDFATHVVHRILHPQGAVGDQVNPATLRARRLFALRCRSAALHLSPDLISELDRLEKDLFPPRSLADAEALASGGDAAVHYLRSRKHFNDIEAAACVRTLRLIGTPKAEKALRSYLNDTRSTVVSELAQATNPLEITSIRDGVQHGEKIPQIVLSHIADLGPLRNSNITSLYLGQTRVSELAPLAELSGLENLDLTKTRVSDLAPLTGLTALRSLRLSETNISDIVHLVGLTALQVLDLSYTRVSRLNPLAELDNLELLNLEATGVNDITPIGNLENLRSLDLARTQVSDLTSLAGLTKLEKLLLWKTQVSNIVPLSRLINLQSLNFWGTPVADLSPLADLKDLQLLDLRFTRVADISPLAQQAALQVLDLRGTSVRDLAPLTELTNLESLTLVDTKVDNINALAGLTKLRLLDLRRTNVVNLKPLEALNLKQLILSDRSSIDTSILEKQPGLVIHWM